MPTDIAFSLASFQAELPADAVEVGRLGAPWGVKGWLHVQAYSASADALLGSRQWYVLPPQRGARQFASCLLLPIQQCRAHGQGLVASVRGVADRDQAACLRSARIFIARTAFPPLQAGEYYWVDLLGCTVRNQQDIPLGVVCDLLSTGAQTTLVLEDAAQTPPRQRLIPFVDAFVAEVDTARRHIVVDWQPEYDE